MTGIIFKRRCIFHSFETGNCVSTANFKQINKEIAAQLSGIKLTPKIPDRPVDEIYRTLHISFITIYDVKVQRYWSHCMQAGL